MNDQWWALGGVVIGAVLGGGAQIVADVLGGRRDRAHYIRDTRRTAYVELIAAETHAWGRTQFASSMIPVATPDADDRGVKRDALLAGRLASERLNSAVAGVGLVAPTDTWDAAIALMHSVGPSSRSGDPTATATHHAARQAFIDLAHRDLGLNT